MDKSKKLNRSQINEKRPVRKGLRRMAFRKGPARQEHTWNQERMYSDALLAADTMIEKGQPLAALSV